MNKIKTYEDFVNEEINLRKAAAGLALGAGLAFGSPAHSQTTTTTQTQQSSKSDLSSKSKEVEKTNQIYGFRNYKLGDTTLYGVEVLSPKKLDELYFHFTFRSGGEGPSLKALEYYSQKWPSGSRIGGGIPKFNFIKWYEKKESLFDKSITIYFAYIDGKLMGIYIELPNSVDYAVDVVELLKSKFGNYTESGGSSEWFINNVYLNFRIGVYQDPSTIKIWNKDLQNIILQKFKYVLDKEDNERREEIIKKEEERIKRIKSETF